jgi:hypothetical protein
VTMLHSAERGTEDKEQANETINELVVQVSVKPVVSVEPTWTTTWPIAAIKEPAIEFHFDAKRQEAIAPEQQLHINDGDALVGSQGQPWKATMQHSSPDTMYGVSNAELFCCWRRTLGSPHDLEFMPVLSRYTD